MSHHKILKLLAMLLFCLLWTATSVRAAPPPPGQEQSSLVYTVQPGDTLMRIALRYNLRLADLILANNLLNKNLIFPGQQLILPGVPPEIITPPPAADGSAAGTTHLVQPGETLFTIATSYGLPIEAITQANNLANPDLIQVGQTLQIPIAPPPPPEPLPAPFAAIDLSEPIIIQGRTQVIKVKLITPAALSGEFEGQPIFFNQAGSGQYWGITAIHVMAEPKTYPITLRATLPDSRQVTTIKNVTVVEGPYGLEDIELDYEHSQLLQADMVKQEQEKLASYWSQVSPRARWVEPFHYPVDDNSPRLTSYFGTRRSYNSSTETSFHGGIDFGGSVGGPIYAAATGRVVMAEKLNIRGNAVLIDHGLGLFSGYWHLNQLAVNTGQEVNAGDLIGFMGNTGLVTGPHLHWEMRLNGIAVQPLQWVQQVIP